MMVNLFALVGFIAFLLVGVLTDQIFAVGEDTNRGERELKVRGN